MKSAFCRRNIQLSPFDAFKISSRLSDYLDIVGGEQSDHRVVFALVPILVHLSSDEYEIATSEGQFPGRLADEIVERSCHQTRLRCLILGSTSLAQIVHEIVVTIQGYGRFLRWSEIVGVLSGRWNSFSRRTRIVFLFAPSKR